MDNNIELKQDYGECFRSDKMMTSTGNYSGQLVMDNNISPINSFTITQWSQFVDIMVDQRTSDNEEQHTNVRNNECVTTHIRTLQNKHIQIPHKQLLQLYPGQIPCFAYEHRRIQLPLVAYLYSKHVQNNLSCIG